MMTKPVYPDPIVWFADSTDRLVPLDIMYGASSLAILEQIDPHYELVYFEGHTSKVRQEEREKISGVTDKLEIEFESEEKTVDTMRFRWPKMNFVPIRNVPIPEVQSCTPREVLRDVKALDAPHVDFKIDRLVCQREAPSIGNLPAEVVARLELYGLSERFDETELIFHDYASVPNQTKRSYWLRNQAIDLQDTYELTKSIFAVHHSRLSPENQQNLRYRGQSTMVTNRIYTDTGITHEELVNGEVLASLYTHLYGSDWWHDIATPVEMYMQSPTYGHSQLRQTIYQIEASDNPIVLTPPERRYGEGYGWNPDGGSDNRRQ